MMITTKLPHHQHATWLTLYPFLGSIIIDFPSLGVLFYTRLLLHWQSDIQLDSEHISNSFLFREPSKRSVEDKVERLVALREAVHLALVDVS